MSDDKLIGWLCFTRLNFSNGLVAMIPNEVQAELLKRGWITTDVPQEDDCHDSSITDAGIAVTDIYGPDWGITTLEEASL